MPTSKSTFAELAKGQSPDVLFVSCSDSRVAPNWFASTDPGDLFVIRNVGNLIPPCDQTGKAASDNSVAAAIEFAIHNLKVTSIVVCGHSGCGAIHAISQGTDELPPSHLKDWLSIAEMPLQGPASTIESRPDLPPEDRMSQKNALQQLINLKTYPTIRDKIQEGKIQLHAWWFDIAQGAVYAFDESSRQFKLIDDTFGESLLKNLKF